MHDLVRIENLRNEGSLQNHGNFNKFSLKHIHKFDGKILGSLQLKAFLKVWYSKMNITNPFV